MNANPKFLAASAHVDDAAVQPLPNSRKIHVGPLRVPMRAVSQSDTPSMFGGEKNPPVYVYDCSGPYSDPAANIDIRSGLPALRESWISRRNEDAQDGDGRMHDGARVARCAGGRPSVHCGAQVPMTQPRGAVRHGVCRRAPAWTCILAGR